MEKKGIFALEEIPLWIIALLVLGIMLGLYFILNTKGNSALDYFKNLWRFGR